MKRLHPDLIGHYNTMVVPMICSKYGYTPFQAFDLFVHSQTHRWLEDAEADLTCFGAGAVFEIWECEKVTGDPRNSVYIRED